MCIRDRLYATGIRVTELVNLKRSDVNMSIGFITCRDEHKERMIPFGHAAKDALAKYLESARETFLKGTRSVSYTHLHRDDGAFRCR